MPNSNNNKNPFDLAEELAPLHPYKDEERFINYATQFTDWLTNLPNAPLQITLTVRPFDATVRGWSYRTFTEAEQQEMIPCHRMFVHCEDMWGEQVLESDMILAQPPESDEGQTDEWLTGIAACLSRLPEVCTEVQTQALGRLFASVGFDSEQFLEETASRLSEQQQLDSLEAMMYIIDMERQAAEADPSDPFTATMGQIAGVIREHMAVSTGFAGFLKDVK